MSKIYRVTSIDFSLDWSAKIAVADDINEDSVRESILFFSSGRELLKTSTNLIETYLKFIAPSLIAIAYRRDNDVSSTINYWKDVTEGYLLLDGSDGITLLDIDYDEFSDDFRVELISEQ